MTYAEMWRSLLGVYDADEAKAVVRLLLEERFGLSYTDVVGGSAEHVSEADLLPLLDRLKQNEPVQYVLGWADFMGHKFHVEPGVLIPRPETAELCQMIISDGSHGNILDIGTGSGCIAISLALALNESRVTAWDISQRALTIAQENAQSLGARVTFKQVDALTAADTIQSEAVEGATPTADNRQWSVIVSNPPYICNKEAALMAKNVLDYEPHEALFVSDKDPLVFYRAIARYGAKTLTKGGKIYFEINPIYADDLCKMASQMGYSHTEIIADDYGKRRFAVLGELSADK